MASGLPRFVLCLVLGGLLGGCRSKTAPGGEQAPPASASASASAAAPAGSFSPIPAEHVRIALNPSSEKPYSGPIGRVRGVVRASGDAAPELSDVLARIHSGSCDDARAFYGKLFREGPGRELGDVLVAVTEYKGYVPATGDVKVVVARGCAFESRTVAMVFGQRLDVRNRGGETFIPRLVGAPQTALLVAIPGGDAAQLFPDHPGQFLLVDQTHDFAQADVFVLKYPTFAVTGIDGAFDIGDVPAGEVLVSAYLPATRQRVAQRVKIVSGEATTVGLTLPFDAKSIPPAPSSSLAP